MPGVPNCPGSLKLTLEVVPSRLAVASPGLKYGSALRQTSYPLAPLTAGHDSHTSLPLRVTSARRPPTALTATSRFSAS